MEHTVVIRQKPVRSGKHSTPDGAICGNGDIGVVLGNHEKGISLHIGKSDFWLSAEDEKRGGGIKPVGILNFDVPDKLYKNYYVEQKMDTGEIYCRFADENEHIQFLIFVSHSTGCVWIEAICSASDSKLNPKFVPSDIKKEKLENFEEDGVLYNRFIFDEDDLVFKLELNAAFKKVDCVERNIYVLSLSSSFDGEKELARIKKYTAKTFDQEREENQKWWKNFYSKSSVSSSDKFLEMNWYASQYLLAVCALNRDFPPGLYGNFITKDGVNWSGDYHLNYNYQGSFYGACSSNHVELTDCYSSPLFDIIDKGRRFARDFLDKKGVFYPVAIGPKGMLTEKSDDVWEKMFLGQRSNAIHSTDIMVMRWYATYDRNYARSIYPLFIEIANFWEDYLVVRDGIYNVVHDAVHEIPYYKSDFDPKDYENEINEENNLLTLGLLKMFFKCLLDISEELGVDAERRDKWRDIVENLHDFPTYERKGKTVFRYTSKGTDWNETNGLCIQHIYPCGQIGLGSDKKLIEISQNTFFSDDRWDDGNAGCSIYPCSARIGIDPKLIISKMKLNFKKFQLPNMLILHGGGCLENSSIASATINEMLLQSYEGILRFFPVWDNDIDCSFVNLRANGAFLVTADFYDGKIQSVKISSEKGRKLKIENPFESALISLDGNRFCTDDRIVEMNTNIGSVVIIEEN